MNLLVTGAAGFIASRVTELLLDAGHSVVGLDNLNDAYDVRMKEWRLARLEDRERFRLTRTDLRDRDALKELFAACSFDAIFHLGARAGVRQSIENPFIFEETNVGGTLNLLELCRDHGIRKFVLASTSSVYGDGAQPSIEDAATDQPLSPYAWSKKAAETLCYTYHHLFNIDVTVLRFFTVYGPAGRPDMSIFRFIRWIAEGEPVTVFGDGNQKRDFTFVDDTARGVISALPGDGYEIINLGSDRPVSINHVIELLEHKLGKKAVIDRQPANPVDVPASWADIHRAERILGWQPQVDIEEGLDRCIDWYMDNRDWAVKVALT
ncbi:MAG: GDP-mannose 4,6-dehydratase [Chloroflexi bacterium]|nr:GDP-mannose 4,6-dehydratase [Chloroflexota bacterium]